MKDLEGRRARLLEDAERGDGSTWEESPESEYRLDGTVFALRPHGARGYRYRLLNGDVTLLLSRKAPAHVPSVIAQLRAPFLWANGWVASVRLVSRLVDFLVAPEARLRPPMVSRVDLCADFQGWIPVPEDLGQFVSRARRRALYLEGKVFSGFVFGRGSVVARLYDKTREIRTSGKKWFEAVWEKGGYFPPVPVWRLEFQVRRDALREFRVDTVLDLARSAPSLWRYLATWWLRLALPVPGVRSDRWPTDSRWTALTDADFGPTGAPAVRTRKRGADEERILSVMFGAATSFGALTGDRSLRTVLRAVGDELERRLQLRGEEFADHVVLKARKLETVRGFDELHPAG